VLHCERDAEMSADFLPSLEHIVCPHLELMRFSVDQHVRPKDRGSPIFGVQAYPIRVYRTSI
jgi:hypothetical protein